MSLVTRGLGGYALVTRGLGDFQGDPLLFVREWEDPFEYHDRQFASGAHRTGPAQARRRLNRRRSRIEAHRHSGGG